MGNMETPNQANYPVLSCSFNFITSTFDHEHVSRFMKSSHKRTIKKKRKEDACSVPFIDHQ
jgi:hypothetical protein